MINKVTLIGNVGGEPDVKQFDNGSKAVRFSLATSSSYKDKSGEWVENTQWHSITCWGNQADRAELLQKGQTLFVEGSIECRDYEKDGVKMKATNIKSSYFRSIKKNESGGQTTVQRPSQVTSNASANDDLPF